MSEWLLMNGIKFKGEKGMNRSLPLNECQAIAESFIHLHLRLLTGIYRSFVHYNLK